MNKFKYTTLGQMLDVLKTHVVSALLFSVLWVMLIAVFTNSVGKYIYAVIGSISYFFSMYGCGERAAKNDKKPYVERGVSLKRCLYTPVLLLIVTLMVMLLFKLTWVLGSDGKAIQEVWAVVTNLISYSWFAPFGTFVGLGKGNLSALGIVLALGLPIAGYFLGYFAAVKGFDIADIIMRVVYEKKKK